MSMKLMRIDPEIIETTTSHVNPYFCNKAKEIFDAANENVTN